MTYYKGMDLSTLPEVEACGGRFYDHKEEKSAIDILKAYGTNAVRIRLWNDPYSPEGEPYGAGTNDLKTTIELAKRIKAAGLEILLDYHYSDFWADPGKQYPPKAWADHDADKLEEDVYEYTRDTLLELKKEGIVPELIQVGNELSNGLLWPLGKVPEYENIARFVKAGVRAVREYAPTARVVIHLDNGGNNALYREWFDHFTANGGDFDIIGLSYYPFWHGTLQMLQNNMNDIALRYGKDLIVAEVSMGYTMEDYASYEQLAPDQRKGYATRQELVEKLEHPMTIQGQCDFMKDFLAVIEQVPEHRGIGFFYWEPAWIPVPGSGWATDAALPYIREAGPGGNEWANQALFDYDGNALPALEVIRDYRV